MAHLCAALDAVPNPMVEYINKGFFFNSYNYSFDCDEYDIDEFEFIFFKKVFEPTSKISADILNLHFKERFDISIN